ncbi:MAG: short chain dehydrogenase, partial [Phycisphaerales bacterium]|nr:short chain dehydrogenase [Phycisphaerales bacterium]
MSDYKGSVALITGGNKGLGLEIARQLGKQGVRVVI